MTHFVEEAAWDHESVLELLLEVRGNVEALHCLYTGYGKRLNITTKAPPP
eukprot:SAG25_NODE_1903_length_2164_cov_5.367070_1_plen_49_part_10